MPQVGDLLAPIDLILNRCDKSVLVNLYGLNPSLRLASVAFSTSVTEAGGNRGMPLASRGAPQTRQASALVKAESMLIY